MPIIELFGPMHPKVSRSHGPLIEDKESGNRIYTIRKTFVNHPVRW